MEAESTVEIGTEVRTPEIGGMETGVAPTCRGGEVAVVLGIIVRTGSEAEVVAADMAIIATTDSEAGVLAGMATIACSGSAAGMMGMAGIARGVAVGITGRRISGAMGATEMGSTAAEIGGGPLGGARDKTMRVRRRIRVIQGRTGSRTRGRDTATAKGGVV